MRTWEEGLLLERRRGEPQSRWKEGSMWEEWRGGRIIKEEEEKKKLRGDGQHVLREFGECKIALI